MDISSNATALQTSTEILRQHKNVAKQDCNELTSKANKHSLSQYNDEMIALCLVQDLLDCLNLQYTSSVFKSEINSTQKSYINQSRQDIINALQLLPDKTTPTDDNSGCDDMEHDSRTFETDSLSTDVSVASAGQSTTGKMDTRRKPILMKVLKTLSDLTGAHSKLKAMCVVDGEDINNDTYITPSERADQISDSL